MNKNPYFAGLHLYLECFFLLRSRRGLGPVAGRRRSQKRRRDDPQASALFTAAQSSPRNHFAADNQWGRSPRSSASTSPMFSTQQTHFAPAADPEKDPVAALGLLASTPLLDRRAQPSPPPRYRSLSKPNSPQKEKTDQWEGV